VALVLSALVFNALIMPRFVRHGREVEVPDVTTLSLEEARQRLQESGLAIRDTLERASPIVTAGVILDQSPRPSLRVKPQRGVSLVVSRGRIEQRIPRITGQTFRSARLRLGQDGYELGDVLRVPVSDVARNFVVASDPPEGSLAPPGERVHLLVSDGPERAVWVMPDLSGRELQLTADRLGFAGFVAVTEGGGGMWFGPHRIRATDPPAGALVAEGDTIRLFGR
jgi:serine/threonine-protein kinase